VSLNFLLLPNPDLAHTQSIWIVGMWPLLAMGVAGQNINDRSVHNPYGPQDGASWIAWPPGLVAWVTISVDLAECQVLKRTKYVQCEDAPGHESYDGGMMS
jgi:hypothetical protein